jgi:hypothetical protein
LRLVNGRASQMKLHKTSRPHRRTIPDWAAVQRAEDAGRTLIEVWREYAAIAEHPYRIGSFRREFRKWQSSTPPSSTSEFVASERYWKGKAHPRPDILVLGDGAALRIRGGHLEAYSIGVTTRFAPGPHHKKPTAIIFVGWGGLLSLAAVHFCIDHKITILATGWLGDLTTFVAPRRTPFVPVSCCISSMRLGCSVLFANAAAHSIPANCK